MSKQFKKISTTLDSSNSKKKYIKNKINKNYLILLFVLLYFYLNYNSTMQLIKYYINYNYTFSSIFSIFEPINIIVLNENYFWNMILIYILYIFL
jgi:hypothetical protein